MSEENTARIYTVNLSKAWDTPKYRRTDRVINIIKEFTQRHMQADKVKIDQDLNRHIWSRGKKNPPRKIRLRMVKEDDDTVVVSSYIEEKRTETESEETISEELVEKQVEEQKEDKVELEEEELVEKQVEEQKEDKVQAKQKEKRKK
ncbi:MAG: 60S ribosomal protein L31 [Thermoproteota archaeon]|jgi:large subunit ribosomal protein L31e|nr:60S ribosomal protein L31 [Thermoproteota archaeon]